MYITEDNIAVYYFNNKPLKYAYYNSMAEKKRTYTIQYLKTIYSQNDVFSYFDAFSSTGIMGLRVSKNFPNAKIIYNDKTVLPGLILLNNIINHTKNYTIYHEDIIKLNLYADIIELDPYGSCIPYLEYIKKVKPLNLIVTHTDLINLCSQKGAKNYFLKYDIDIISSKINYELAIRALLWIYHKHTNLIYELKAYYIVNHYITLYLKLSEKQSIKYIPAYICSCGYSGDTAICVVCMQKLHKIGPLYVNENCPLGPIGGLNKIEFIKIRKISLKDKTIIDYGFIKSDIDGIFKSSNFIECFKSLDTLYPYKDPLKN